MTDGANARDMTGRKKDRIEYATINFVLTMANRIDKAFEGRWRFKGCKDGSMNLSLSLKELCKDFFEAGIAYNLTTNRSNHMKCPLCGGMLVWGGDNDAHEVSDMYDVDDGAVASNYTCQQCGRYIEIIEPPKEEREGEYKEYWHHD